MKPFRKILFFAPALFTPAKIFACAACGSANPNADHSSLIDGMNLGILVLMGVLLPVLGAFLTFLIYAIRRSAALTAAAEKNSLEAAKI